MFESLVVCISLSFLFAPLSSNVLGYWIQITLTCSYGIPYLKQRNRAADVFCPLLKTFINYISEFGLMQRGRLRRCPPILTKENRSIEKGPMYSGASASQAVRQVH